MAVILSDPLHGDRTLTVFGVTVPWPFPVAKWIHSSSAVMFGRRVYGRDRGKLFMAAFSLLRRASDFKYWVFYRVHPGYKYHVVNTNLRPGYYDVDTRMLHACFSLLREYVEIECGGPEKLKLRVSELVAEALEESEDVKESMTRQVVWEHVVLCLYEWWTVTRPADEARIEELTSEIYSSWRGKIEKTEMEDGSIEISFPENPNASKLRDELRALQKKVETDDLENSKALMEIRTSLWT